MTSDEARVNQFGLQPGDIVTSLDGQPFSDPTQAMELFRQVASGAVMTAKITRNGQSLDVTLDGRSIVAAQERLDQSRMAQAVPVAQP